MWGLGRRFDELWAPRSREALQSEALLRRALLSLSFLGAVLAGLFVESLALVTAVWLLCAVIAAWATAPIWLDMQRSLRPFNYVTLMQLMGVALFGLNAVNNPYLALPCAGGGLLLCYTAFRNPAELSPGPGGHRIRS